MDSRQFPPPLQTWRGPGVGTQASPTAVTYPEGLVDTQHPHSGPRTRLVLADAVTACRGPEAIEKKGWRMHCGAEVTESSTNKRHHLKPYSTVHSPTRLRISESRESERERERERGERKRALLGTFHNGGSRASPAQEKQLTPSPRATVHARARERERRGHTHLCAMHFLHGMSWVTHSFEFLYPRVSLAPLSMPHSPPLLPPSLHPPLARSPKE